ncbi:MAG: hypothetical protein KBC74_00605 [Candidatus Pacebacteria bacterium]|nr:hypothetical protein [Candidatus Paceibacterota bacterium]
MLTAAYFGCWFFWDKLKYMMSRNQHAFLWASIYGCILFLTLLTNPSLVIMSGVGPRSIWTGLDAQLGMGVTHVITPWFHGLFISIVLAIILYVAFKLLSARDSLFQKILIVGGGFFISQVLFYFLAYPYMVIG